MTCDGMKLTVTDVVFQVILTRCIQSVSRVDEGIKHIPDEGVHAVPQAGQDGLGSSQLFHRNTRDRRAVLSPIEHAAFQIREITASVQKKPAVKYVIKTLSWPPLTARIWRQI